MAYQNHSTTGKSGTTCDLAFVLLFLFPNELVVSFGPELKKRQMSIDANMKNSRAAPRSTSSNSANGSTPVEKPEPVISRKVFKNIAGIKKIIGIYGDWIE